MSRRPKDKCPRIESAIIDVDALIAGFLGSGPKVKPNFFLRGRPGGRAQMAFALSRDPFPHERRLVELALIEFAQQLGAKPVAARYVQGSISIRRPNDDK